MYNVIRKAKDMTDTIWKMIRVPTRIHDIIKEVSMMEKRTMIAVLEKAIMLYKNTMLKKRGW